MRGVASKPHITLHPREGMEGGKHVQEAERGHVTQQPSILLMRRKDFPRKVPQVWNCRRDVPQQGPRQASAIDVPAFAGAARHGDSCGMAVNSEIGFNR